MNINEVKKHVFINILLYIMIGLCLFFSLIFILLTPVNAREVTTDITNTVVSDFNCLFGQGGRGYCAIDANNNGGIRSFNTLYNGTLTGISFAFPFYFNQNSASSQKITITANDNDFRNNNLSVYCYSYETSPSQATPNNCSVRFISQKQIQVIFPYNVLQWHEIILNGSPLTGVSNYRLNSVKITYDDGQQDNSGIISNATQNTTDIINNNNSNTETIVDVMENNANTISDLLGDVCTNVFNPANYSNIGSANLNYANASAISATSTDIYGRVSYLVDLSPNTNYHLDFKVINSQNEASFFVIQDIYSNDTPVNYSIIGSGTSNHITFTTNSTGAYWVHLYVSTGYYGNTTQWYDIMLSPYNKPYCTYGKLISRFDGIEGAITGGLDNVNDTINDGLQDVKDIQQDQYNYLTDNSDPSVNTSGINNVIGSVQVQDPLNYLLTLPINLLSKLNTLISSGTCTKASFGELYGTEIYLPCINFENYLGSSLWTTIDTIAGIGLLVIIIKKFYDTISNILSLGKEEEIRKGMELPTPMEFLAKILGGGS